MSSLSAVQSIIALEVNENNAQYIVGGWMLLQKKTDIKEWRWKISSVFTATKIHCTVLKHYIRNLLIW